tara:strand:- start:23 stop:397 length:375 start_codon:yes stop_codon:yes gene_type:complete
MAWTTISKTPLLWKLTQDASAAGATTGYTDEISTDGYDMATFIATLQPLEPQMKYDSAADGSLDAWATLQAEAGFMKTSTTSDTGFVRAPIPTVIRFKDTAGSPADVGNAYVELRRTASWDRGN